MDLVRSSARESGTPGNGSPSSRAARTANWIT
jgi:hypothetical protein